MDKVFGIGFHKTATTSLGRALQALGYRVQGYDLATSRKEARRKAAAHLETNDVLEDFPWPLIYRWLDETYPGSKFILTVRPEDAWIESVCRHFGGGSIPMHEWIYGAGDPVGNEEQYLERYRQHNHEVKSYFGDRRGTDLLVLDITKGDHWDRLCPFLGLETPPVRFPRGMISEKKQGEMSMSEWLQWRFNEKMVDLLARYRQRRRH